MAPEINNLYRFDDFELHPGRRTLTRLGEKIPLAPKTFDVLVYLVTNAGRVVLKQDLLSAVWPGSFVEEGNLTQHIFGLRKALADRSSCIVTIPGRGYQFTALVEALPDTPTIANPPESAPLISPPSPSPHRRPYWLYVLSLLAICGLIALATRGRIRGAVPGDHHEVVLADFENSTGDPDLDHSLKTLLAIDLTQSPTLVVASDSDTRKVLKLMSRPSDSDLTPTLAREVCERLNDQVVLSGLIARFGQKYLVTLTAADCSTGKDLVHTKAVASNRDEVIAAVDSASADMRARLGEPLPNLQRGQPLLLAHTFSLDALKAYSQARALHSHAKFAAAVPFYQKAIQLDPNFTDAWAQIANCYNNLGEAQLGRDAMAKAYELRDQTDEPGRLRITAMYEYWKTGDRHAAIRTYQKWATLYPNSVSAWVLLGEFQASVGRTDLGIAAEQHALAIDPASPDAAWSLAAYQREDGRLDDAKATCRNAFAHGTDNTDLRRTLLEIAFLQHDDAALQQQLAWFKAQGSESDLENALGDLDAAQGKYHSAATHYLRVADLQKADGLNEAALESFSNFPAWEAEVGLTDLARQHFQRYVPFTHLIEPSFMAVITAAAELHQFDVARTYLNYMLENGKQDSDVQEFYAPMGRAAIDLAQNHPDQAIADLKSSDAFELSDPALPAMRSRAYLAAHQPEAAAHELHVLIDRPYESAISPNVPLAHLGLARALQQQGNPAAARQEYETFFTLWRDADPTLPILKQAHQEYAKTR
jgi:DNA-binding winged helix-turn-helix (wHTH) protein/tetratricopeptide (TPR) repeat protein